MIRPLLALTFVIPAIALASTPRLYLSPMETSSWSLTADTPLRCEISHEIPRFGTAVFYQEAGRDLKLEIRTKQAYQKDIDIIFRSVTAGWKGIQYETELARVKSTGNHQLVDLSSDYARHAYVELEQGYQPSVFFSNPEDEMSEVVAVLSTVNFRDIEASFAACVSRLYPDNYEDVRLARLHFEFDEEFPLESEEQTVFKRMLDYIKVDTEFQYLSISGHADFKGTECYNDTLSSRRAWYVYDLLVQSGMEPNQLRVEFHGERKPLVQGKDDDARAANRRVSVTLVK